MLNLSVGVNQIINLIIAYQLHHQAIVHNSMLLQSLELADQLAFHFQYSRILIQKIAYLK